MDIGSTDSASVIMKPMLGKRELGEAINEECSRDTEHTSHKCSKVDGEADNAMKTSAGVVDHLCREAVANEAWKVKFPGITVTHIISHALDHLPLILQNHAAPRQNTRRDCGFKFEEAWLLWDDRAKVVQDAWENSEVGETASETVRLKINGCSMDLRAWGASKIRAGTKEIKDLQKQIEWLTSALSTEQYRSEFIQASKELDEWLRKQKVYWAQRSRVNQIKHGDKNTRFFHSKATERRQRNYIKGILDPQGG
ncbi:uncharacterized protein LOC142632919 [Castanea sativa]|uniref:uncharacterized protein LOC142632919 n=1 Tax=Castanea sativa TaxID=21020 RepID=UPI003F64C709